MSLRNAQLPADGGTGEFVVNIASEVYATKVAAAAEPLPYGESEFDLTGLTPTRSVKVRPPRVTESPVSFECRTMQVIGPTRRRGRWNIVIGQVVHIHAAEGLLNERLHADPRVSRPSDGWAA